MPRPAPCPVEVAIRRLSKLASRISLAHMTRATCDTIETWHGAEDVLQRVDRLRAGLVAIAHEAPNIWTAANLQAAVDMLVKERAARRHRAGPDPLT